MENLTKLWVRACASENPRLRCESILRRFYLLPRVRDELVVALAISQQLLPIVDEYCDVNLAFVITSLSPESFGITTVDVRPYIVKVSDMLISTIVTTKKSKFVGL